jgi:hypothetical protein
MDMPSSTRRSRRERREEAERVKPSPAPEDSDEPAAAAPEPEKPEPEKKEKPTVTAETTTRPQPVSLVSKTKPAKRPFATQLRPSTVARLDWIRRQNFSITDTVDDAVNAWLDAAGVPPADEHGEIQQ